ncbi:MAG TPA: aminotransferase class I/II-fold pyridoxal phosphate-dependent enzyme [Gemmatimonadales bacterium]|nr:aminotransferase class I/II-fold pyridoxal phosphate-dependent enzyme [Gemmatimonadales bacterium]
MRFSSRIERLGGEGAEAWIVHDRAVGRMHQGDEIYLLSIGDPDFETPAPIRQAAVSALASGRTHYSPSGGEPALRSAIAERASTSLGLPVAPEQVIVYPGAQAALFALAQCLFDPGDEVIVPEPTYVTYEAMLGAAGATMRLIPLRPERAFHLDPEDIARAIGPRTRGIMLNFPHNPTGAILTREEAKATAGLCRRHDLALISDEVYAALNFTGEFVSPASLPGMAERTAVVSSLSKSHAMTGWRCGWSITSPALAAHLEKLVRCMHFGVAQFVQDAGAAAFHQAGREAAELRSAYLGRARVVVDRLQRVPGIACRLPEAGMYVFADVRGTGLSGKRFAALLLDATGVAVTPGEGFGPSGAGHVRITLGTGERRLAEACELIAGFVEHMVARAS